MRNVMTIGEREVPALWVICEECQGEGSSSSYLGSYTREEFEDAFTSEEQEQYFSGGWDRQCDVCHGSGKVLEPDFSRMSRDDERYVREWLAEEAEYQALCRSERRMGA